MKRKRRVFSGAFRAKVALAAAKGDKTLSELASQFDVHANQVSAWRKELIDRAAELFEDGRRRQPDEEAASQQELYEQIGRLKVELDWLKKNLPSLVEVKRSWIELGHPTLSARRQCELLSLSRSCWHYRPAAESAENLRLMRLIDEQYLRRPYFGSRRMALWLNEQREQVNRKRVQRLMRLMGIEAIYPRPRTTQRNAKHRVFPYLLRDVAIERPNHVWSSDITYVPMPRGFMYLTAVIDWYSRHVLAWRLSNTLEGSFCVDVLDDALRLGTPQIFNTDQGVQYTAAAFIERLQRAKVAISMDGRGRALDNVFVERLWRSVKHECLYLHGFSTVAALKVGLTEYFDFYCHQRPHQGLNNSTPAEVYRRRVKRR
jgi:putative transposase